MESSEFGSSRPNRNTDNFSDEEDNTLEPFEDQANQIISEVDLPGDDDFEEGEDLMNNAEDDYRAIPELDTFEQQGIDDEQLDESMEDTLANKRRAELAMNNRNNEFGFDGLEGKARDQALFYEDDDEMTLKDREAIERSVAVDTDHTTTNQAIEHLEDTRDMSTREWVARPEVQNEISHRFKHYLRNYVDESGIAIFREKIDKMVEENGQSIIIGYETLCDMKPVLAYFLPEAPKEMLTVFDKAATEVVFQIYPRYHKIHKKIFIRIARLPILEQIRNLRCIHISQLITIEGVVASSTSVTPQMAEIRYKCMKCSTVTQPFTQSQTEEVKPTCCLECQSRGPFQVDMEKTVYQNYQRIRIQESPSSVRAGRLPRSKEAILLADLVDTCKPGDEIRLTGIYEASYEGSLNVKNGFPVFTTVIMANFIERKEDENIADTLTDQDVDLIKKMAKDEVIGDKIINSIAPSIFGHEDSKRAIALSLFGGQPKNPQGKHKIRGDINILLCGDPGTAKSQFLKYIQKTAPRCVFSTGQGASAVGLTAYVQRHPTTGEWTLEAGALVLADRGVCLIDEFDKMNDADRTSIHEAMEQQSISISKAGIVTSLRARCTVIAAANPIGGKYDASLTFSENVDLTEPILSRFDVLLTIKDHVDPVIDEQLAFHVVRSHRKSHPNVWGHDDKRVEIDNIPCPLESGKLSNNLSEDDCIPQDLLRKYIIYAKQRCHPKIQSVDQDKMARMYSELRKESIATGSIPITVRHIEAIIRLAEAHARMHLRHVVTADDFNMATRVALESFVNTQKMGILKQMRKTFGKYLNYKKDEFDLLMFLVRQLTQEKISKTNKFNSFMTNDGCDVKINESELVEKARHLGLKPKWSEFWRQDELFKKAGYTYNGKTHELLLCQI